LGKIIKTELNEWVVAGKILGFGDHFRRIFAHYGNTNARQSLP